MLESLLPEVGAQWFLPVCELQDPGWSFCPQVFLDGISDEVRGAIGIGCGHVCSSLLIFLSVVIDVSMLSPKLGQNLLASERLTTGTSNT